MVLPPKLPADARRFFEDPETLSASWDLADRIALSLTKPAERSTRGWSPASYRTLVQALGEGGLLRLVADARDGGRFEQIRWGAVALGRERLGFASPQLDLAFVMQGLGSYPITLGGDDAQRARYLPDVIAGHSVAAFALTEADAGSDLSRITTRAHRDEGGYRLSGRKIFISNAPVADVFTVFAKTEENAKRPLSAFVVRSTQKGVRVVEQQVLGDHPIGEVHLDEVSVSSEDRLGDEGDGLRLALGTLHRFRPTVGAAAVGFAERALQETLHHVRAREQFGRPLGDLQAVQLGLAEMACDIACSRLLVYRAAALADASAGREAEALAGSMAKLTATEKAFQVIDRAVQFLGARGVDSEGLVAQLYKEIRSLRIYEGASDVQRLLIARHLLTDHGEDGSP